MKLLDLTGWIVDIGFTNQNELCVWFIRAYVLVRLKMVNTCVSNIIMHSIIIRYEMYGLLNSEGICLKIYSKKNLEKNQEAV